MKKSELFFSALLVPVDYFMILVAGIFAYNLRFVSLFTDIRPVMYEIVFRQYLQLIFIVAAILVAVFALAGLYTIRNTRRWLDEMSLIAISSTAGIAVVIIIIFFQREMFSSRFIVLFGWILSILMVMIGRLIVRIVQHLLLKKGIGVHNVIIIGQDQTTEEIVRQLYKFPGLGYRIIERYPDFGEESVKAMTAKIGTVQVNELIQADTHLPKEQIMALKEFCAEHHIIFKYTTDLFDIQPTHIEISTIADIPVIELRRTKLDGWGKIIKRVFDIFFSVIFLIILSPLFLFLSILIKIDSVGSVFVRLERIGEKGERFSLFKFRSMVKNAHLLKNELVDKNERADGPLFKIKDDPRITRIGRFLRKSSFDELPQLFNVLHGEMSLVGPRPHEPEEVSRYEPWQIKLLAIKPGMTGLAQISGRSDLKFCDEAKLDIYYIENWSPKMDMQIILKTPRVVFTGKSAS